jgi:guanylate kinase
MPKADDKTRPENQPDSSASASTGRLFVISAPSGAGKTTLCRLILPRLENMHFSVSYTTRPPRPGETEGKDYHFISRQDFEKMIEKNLWAEWAKVHDNYYGTSCRDLQRDLESGYDVLLDIDVKGMRQIVSRFPQTITIFIMPPSLRELQRRLEKRNSDGQKIIDKRLKAAAEEIALRHEYDYIIVNDSLDKAAGRLLEVIENNRRPSGRKDNYNPK